MFTAFAALCDPGDEVICPAPYWTTYPEAITLAGGVPVVVQTDETTGFKVTVEQLDAALTPRTKALLFVSPDNPSGAVYSPAEVAAIGRWALEKGVWVLTDEIYEHLVYGDNKFVTHAHDRPRAGQPVRDRQRCCQDLRDDRLACRLDDRADRHHEGSDQLSVAQHVQRHQRRTGGRAGGRQRRPVGGCDDARGVRPPSGHHARACSTRSRV